MSFSKIRFIVCFGTSEAFHLQPTKPGTRISWSPSEWKIALLHVSKISRPSWPRLVLRTSFPTEILTWYEMVWCLCSDVFREKWHQDLLFLCKRMIRMVLAESERWSKILYFGLKVLADTRKDITYTDTFYDLNLRLTLQGGGGTVQSPLLGLLKISTSGVDFHTVNHLNRLRFWRLNVWYLCTYKIKVWFIRCIWFIFVHCMFILYVWLFVWLTSNRS